MTEDEQIAQIKDWWQRNGKPLLTGGVLALALVFGWKGWQEYQSTQAQTASLIYQQLLETSLTAEGKPDIAKVAELAGKLDDAAAELKALADKPVDATVAELARQRLARVLAAQGKVEEGLKLLDGEAGKAWLASREELKGDLLVQLGRVDDAHAAYQKAKQALADDAAVGGLQMKLDDLAKGDA